MGKGLVKQDKINCRNPQANWKTWRLIYCLKKSINQYEGFADLSDIVTDSRTNIYNKCVSTCPHMECHQFCKSKQHQELEKMVYGKEFLVTTCFSGKKADTLVGVGWQKEQKMNKSKTTHDSTVIKTLGNKVGVKQEAWQAGWCVTEHGLLVVLTKSSAVGLSLSQ